MQTIIDTSDGADALLQNQLYTIAAGGNFWESGGSLSSGGSSSSIKLSVSSVTVNIGGDSVTHGSQPVTLSATNSDYRSDVIYADSSGIGKVEGVEMAKLPSDNQFPSIWQPAPDNGSLVPGVPLWVVHIQPSDAASADIASWQMQNRRMNAETINTDAVISLLEDYDTAANGPVQTTVQNSAALGGQSAEDWQQTSSALTHAAEVPAGNRSVGPEMWVPAGYTLTVERCGVVSAERTGGASTRVRFYVRDQDTSPGTQVVVTDEPSVRTPNATLDGGSGGKQVLIDLVNDTDTGLQLTGHGFVTLFPTQ